MAQVLALSLKGEGVYGQLRKRDFVLWDSLHTEFMK
jgi:hypothetical protein